MLLSSIKSFFLNIWLLYCSKSNEDIEMRKNTSKKPVFYKFSMIKATVLPAFH